MNIRKKRHLHSGREHERAYASPTGPTCITTSYKGSCVAVRDCPQTSGISLDARVNSVCGEEKRFLYVWKKKIPDSFTKKFKEARTANIQHWPWTAAVFYHVKGNPGIRSCGATLITARHLLTAATCVSYAGTARNFSILLGQNHIETQDSKKQEIFLESLITHENFEPLRFENDLAILKLERPVEYSDSISPVCLPYNLSTKNIDAKTAYITGWGQTTPGGEFSKNMQVLHVPTWNQKDCQDKYENTTTIIKTMLCAGHPEGGTDACMGFSGSPLVLLEENKFSVVGILSFGRGCGGPFPAVYTRVTEYLDWIESNLH
ncbi:trypsin-1-like [Tachypleus tridentatus]|uniref:trypsin-1-like n=1 Tax=Tachypleus tridentatus TaxID=6853 RepID=UPI003FCF2FB2